MWARTIPLLRPTAAAGGQARSLTMMRNHHHHKPLGMAAWPRRNPSANLLIGSSNVPSSSLLSRGRAHYSQEQQSISRLAPRSRRHSRLLLACGFAGIAGGLAYAYQPTIRSWTDRTVRFSRAAATAVIIAYDYKTSLKGLEGEERKKVIKEVHKRSAERLLKLFQKNKGIYVKAGQHISSLDYILPIEYVTTMFPLHDKAPTCPWEDIERTFIEEFNSHPDVMFEEFEREPVAAASLAQVHRARLRDGSEVAVKVQFPQLRERCEGDVSTIAFLVDATSWFFPEFDFQWLVGEFRFNLPKELNFVQEAKNAERTQTLFSTFPNVSIPKIFWNYTTSRVLTMEYIHGVKLDDKEGLEKMGVSVHKVAELLTTVFCKQIFIDGFVHCDPHPGNVLVRKRFPNNPKSDEPDLVLLDHGLYRELGEDFRVNYCHLWQGIIEMDEEKIKKYSKIMCGPDASHELFAAMLTARAWESLHELDMPLTPEEKEKLAKGAAERFGEINDILATIPSELLLLLKTNDLLRALNRELGHPINTYTITVRFCISGLIRQEPSLANSLQLRFQFYLWLFKLKAVECYFFFKSFFRSLTSFFSLHG